MIGSYPVSYVAVWTNGRSFALPIEDDPRYRWEPGDSIQYIIGYIKNLSRSNETLKAYERFYPFATLDNYTIEPSDDNEFPYVYILNFRDGNIFGFTGKYSGMLSSWQPGHNIIKITNIQILNQGWYTVILNLHTGEALPIPKSNIL